MLLFVIAVYCKYSFLGLQASYKKGCLWEMAVRRKGCGREESTGLPVSTRRELQLQRCLLGPCWDSLSSSLRALGRVFCVHYLSDTASVLGFTWVMLWSGASQHRKAADARCSLCSEGLAELVTLSSVL